METNLSVVVFNFWLFSLNNLQCNEVLASAYNCEIFDIIRYRMRMRWLIAVQIISSIALWSFNSRIKTLAFLCLNTTYTHKMLTESRWENKTAACKSCSDKNTMKRKGTFSPLFSDKHLSGHYLQISDDHLLVINHAHAVASPAARSYSSRAVNVPSL